MVPPPATPSPHRFVKPKPASSAAKPPSSLRYQATQTPSTQQFAPTPRFTFGSTQKASQDGSTAQPAPSSPLARRPIPPALPKPRHEDIEDPNSSHSDHEETPHDTALKTPTHKRRRRNQQEDAIFISSSPPSLAATPPTTPPHPTIEVHDEDLLDNEVVLALPEVTDTPFATHHHDHHPRFRLPSSVAKPSPAPHDSHSIPSRPPVILPPREPTPPPATPSAFYSPSRRGQKYVAGGLAATVRDWIVEASQQTRWKAHNAIWDHVIVIEEVQIGDMGDGALLVRERGQEGRKWMLAGGKGRREAEPFPGAEIGVKEPTWEVHVRNEPWMVGVEWKVLSEPQRDQR